MKERIVWALKHANGKGFLFASGCYLAPWIFSTRQEARKALRVEAIVNGLACYPVKILLQVKFGEVPERKA